MPNENEGGTEEINVEDGLQKVALEMNNIENTLIDTGFPLEQWVLIKSYILAAIHRQQLFDLRAAQQMKFG